MIYMCSSPAVMISRVLDTRTIQMIILGPKAQIFG